MISRRDFLSTTAAAAAGLIMTNGATASSTDATATMKGPRKLQFVPAKLLPSRHLSQVQLARDTYLAIPNDDLLYGFRKRADQPTPGNPMTGWCGKDSSVIFGQIISGLARLSSYLRDDALKQKAIDLHKGWRATTAPDGNCFTGTYGFDKFTCGIVDLKLYCDYDDTEYLLKMTEWASKHFDRTRSPGGPLDWDGRQPHGTLEWYTLGENLYRAYQTTGNEAFRNFADIWQYPAFWNKLATTSKPTTAHTVHAYSHVNTFCSAAMAYGVSGDPHFLKIITNAYDYLQATQCYCTGGFGPIERLVAPDGRLGKSLSYVTDHAEIGCGSWAGFKLSKYLIEFTADGKYGDWIEQLFHNSIGSSLPVMGDGRTYYYSDYRTSGGDKLYYWQNWPCCAGTYIQAVGDYHALIYFKDVSGVYVNLYTPSEITTRIGGGDVTITQEGRYPELPESTLTIKLSAAATFNLSLRVPSWCEGMKVAVNGKAFAADRSQGWLAIHRTWADGDKVVITLPMQPRLSAVDTQHPDRCAVLFGPLVLAQEARYTRPLMLADHRDVVRRFVPGDQPLHFKVNDDVMQDPRTGPFKPLYAFDQRETYRLYHDLKEPYLY